MCSIMDGYRVFTSVKTITARLSYIDAMAMSIVAMLHSGPGIALGTGFF